MLPSVCPSAFQASWQPGSALLAQAEQGLKISLKANSNNTGQIKSHGIKKQSWWSSNTHAGFLWGGEIQPAHINTTDLFGREKVFVNTFDFPSYMAHNGANFETHLSTEYNTNAFQSWTRHSTIIGQSPFKKILNTTKPQTSHSDSAPTAEITYPVSTFPYDFIFLSLHISPLLFPPHTPVQLSDNRRPVIK